MLLLLLMASVLEAAVAVAVIVRVWLLPLWGQAVVLLAMLLRALCLLLVLLLPLPLLAVHAVRDACTGESRCALSAGS